MINSVKILKKEGKLMLNFMEKIPDSEVYWPLIMSFITKLRKYCPLQYSQQERKQT
jgi:hypothetical protein